MSKSKIAVITRTKDRTIFLKRALVSVSSQAFKDYVHVIVNDGGDKRAVDDLVASLSADQKARTKVFHRETSSGGPDTIFNESIDRIDSEYFAIHDDDDTWHADFLSETTSYLDEHTQIAAVVVRTDKVIEAVTNHEIREKKRYSYMPDLHEISLYRQCIDNQFTPIATLFRRSAYESVGKFDDTLPVLGDWEFGVRVLEKFDAAFIDPGFALANYHHRHAGDNSFARHSHRVYFTKVANRYLRRDLDKGSLGIGYIMNKLKYDETVRHSMFKKVLPETIIKWYRQK